MKRDRMIAGKKLLIIFGMLCVLFIAGCVQNQKEIKEILISGIDQTEEISSDVPVDLVVSGIKNQITVLEGTEINSIIVSGVDGIFLFSFQILR